MTGSVSKRRRELRAETRYPMDIWSVRCEKCQAPPFELCKKPYGGGFIPAKEPHPERVSTAEHLGSW